MIEDLLLVFVEPLPPDLGFLLLDLLGDQVVESEGGALLQQCF